jgi:hypothetical protein
MVGGSVELSEFVNDDQEVQVGDKVKRACRHLLGPGRLPLPEGFRTHVMEVFSPPRITEEATKQGLSEGGTWDLQCNWDVFDAEDRARFWRSYARSRPYMVTLSPERRAFSALMRINWDRMDPVEAEDLLRRGIEMLLFAMMIAIA